MAGSNSTVQRRGGFGKFFRGVKAELRKVVWPTKKELINYTIVVFIVTVFIAALIGVVDAIFAQLFNMLMHFVGQEAITWKQKKSGMLSIPIQAMKIK